MVSSPANKQKKSGPLVKVDPVFVLSLLTRIYQSSSKMKYGASASFALPGSPNGNVEPANSVCFSISITSITGLIYVFFIMFVLYYLFYFQSPSARNLSKSYKIFFYIFVRFDLWSPPSHLGHSSELDGSRFVVGSWISARRALII